MKVLIEFIAETGKKKKIKYILGISIILNQSDTEGAENLTCRESLSSYAA